MPFPIKIPFDKVPDLFNGNPVDLTIHSGLTIFVGPNGSGKTQFLKFLRANSHVIPSICAARYISAGRLGFYEQYRSNAHGGRSYTNPEDAYMGDSGTKQYRLSSESAIGDFFTLSDRVDILIKVAERLRKIFHRDIILEWDSGRLKVNFKRTNEVGSVYTSAKEASGLLHLVSILTAIYNDEISILFIDEPEISLHPQLQAFLRMEMERVAGDPKIPGKKAIIISTHSPEFITIRRPEDICNFVFFSTIDTSPKQLAFDAKELKYNKIRSLLMRMGHIHKAAFFAQRPLMVEGPSDEIICSFLEGKCDLYLNAAGSQILPVIGKDQMPIVTKLFQAIGKTPVILTDLDSIADGTSLINALSINDKAEQKAQDFGHKSVHEMTKLVYGDFTKIVDNHWTELEIHLTSETITDSTQKKRVLLKYLLNSGIKQLNSLPFKSDLITARKRFDGLLGILEEAGCFLLRKGTIEDYYFAQPNVTTSDKITSAASETESMDQLPMEQINSQYADVIKALKYASLSPDINEAEAVSEILLSFAAPAISKLTSPSATLEITNMAMRLLGDKASLFKFEVEQLEGNNTLLVDKNSTILNVQGFPVKFTQQSNPNEVVKNNIKPL
ncbi:ATP-dependent nuclease [Spirosoma validum]|uniref:AAA family ATPase n=1 Tax=Spirosoma validum TaxID=2771355 RepID=A0A927B1P3_9BACT|nr:AAA family ATPase [Spirosoma validum]MBD2753749.1 AAA family ATPase [Spirosoma validum]